MAFDRNSEHREALLPPGPYEPSGVNNSLPFNSEDPEGAQSTFETVRPKPLKTHCQSIFHRNCIWLHNIEEESSTCFSFACASERVISSS